MIHPFRRLAVLTAVALLVSAWTVDAQEPQTRAEALRIEREEKAKELEPPEPSRLERVLLDLESGRLFERVLNPAEGLYPKFGSITAGSGFSIGPGYRKVERLGGAADLSTFAMASFK
jgi:hypothetical protein